MLSNRNLPAGRKKMYNLGMSRLTANMKVAGTLRVPSAGQISAGGMCRLRYIALLAIAGCLLSVSAANAQFGGAVPAEQVVVGLAAAELGVVEAEGWVAAELAAAELAGVELAGVELAAAVRPGSAPSIAPSIPGNPSATAASEHKSTVPLAFGRSDPAFPFPPAAMVLAHRQAVEGLAAAAGLRAGSAADLPAGWGPPASAAAPAPRGWPAASAGRITALPTNSAVWAAWEVA